MSTSFKFVPSTMFKASLHTTQSDAVDWLALADQLFPADVLQTAPPALPVAVVANTRRPA